MGQQTREGHTASQFCSQVEWCQQVLKAHVRKLEQRASEGQGLQAEEELAWKTRLEAVERERDQLVEECKALEEMNKVSGMDRLGQG